MKNLVSKIALTACLILILILAGGCGQQEEAANEPIEVAPVTNKVDVFGVVKSIKATNITLDFPGIIEEVLVQEGDLVEKGTPLFIINFDSFLTEIQKLEGELAIANLEQNKIRNTIVSLQNKEKQTAGEIELSVASLEDDLKSKKTVTDLAFAEELHQRALSELAAYEKLFQSGAISLSQLEQYQLKAAEREQEINSLKHAIENDDYTKAAELERLKLKAYTLDNISLAISEAQNQLMIQQRRIEQLKLELASLKQQLNKNYLDGNKVVANLNKGVVSNSSHKNGDFITPTDSLLTLISLEKLVVEADVVEEFMADISLGAEAVIVPLADKSREYRGQITKISSKAIVKNGETIVPVEISIINQDEFLLPNFNVDVAIYK
ncbi:MAG: efflux RND transporter periplasmic adaptor subunit [Bacillota bacterium]|nr:efflux RND transporter periplasmic adaptor subunit [Bacillota bacterium]